MHYWELGPKHSSASQRGQDPRRTGGKTGHSSPYSRTMQLAARGHQPAITSSSLWEHGLPCCGAPMPPTPAPAAPTHTPGLSGATYRPVSGHEGRSPSDTQPTWRCRPRGSPPSLRSGGWGDAVVRAENVGSRTENGKEEGMERYPHSLPFWPRRGGSSGWPRGSVPGHSG